jgi:hypothetical protein
MYNLWMKTIVIAGRVLAVAHLHAGEAEATVELRNDLQA